ncbi:hypothetical protein, partial [Vibrio anguillarum]|uniref:hypothetical protein n=1 Tax=Vibrio anguillarum TaxID=55601 RepID=UPI001F2EF067
MSKNQGIIEFLAMSGILPLAIFLIIILGGIGFLLLAVFSMSKDKSASCAQQDGSECKRLDTYYDPSLPERSCPNCSGNISKGKVVCSTCGELDSNVISTEQTAQEGLPTRGGFSAKLKSSVYSGF